MRRVLLALITAVLCVVCLPRLAGAQTTIAGGNIINQTWTTAGSPYVIQGDATVPSGAFLTIQAGVVVQFAGSDGQAAGLDTSRVELTVNGTLSVNGTAASPVNFQAQSGSGAGTWYGVVVGSGAASATFTSAVIRHATYGIRSDASGGVLQVLNSTFQTSTYGIYLLAGSPTLNGVTVLGNSTGIYATGSSGPTVSSCVVRSNSGNGIYIYTTSGSTTSSIDGCVVYGNNSDGIEVRSSSGSSATATIKNSNITHNLGTGVYRYTLSGTANVSVTYSNVWGNGTNYQNAAGGTGTLSANPLYVNAPSELRLTSNSPSRYAGESGQDLGPLPYVSDPTNGYHGTLWVNTTLTAAGSPYTISGDMTVPPGVTLTIQPGATLQFATSDVMGSGDDTSRAELRVQGTITAAGTAAAPITITSTGSGAGIWYGLSLLPGATGSTLSQLTINEATYGIRYDTTGTVTMDHLALAGSTYGLYALSGSPTLNAITVNGNSTGLYLTGSSGSTITNAVVRSNSGIGVYAYTTSGNSQHSLHSSTVYGNNSDGVEVRSSSGSSATMAIRNCIITSNLGTGVYRYTLSGTANVTVTYSDVWGNGTNYQNAAGGAGAISQNPLFVAAPGDLRLQSTSVCIDAGTSTGAPNTDRDDVLRPLNGDGLNGAEYDMGAYEHIASSFCGDGVLAPGEVCDSGPNNGQYGYCNATCSGMGPFCGDGMTNGPEQCDDANASNTDACLTTCMTASCGDGYTYMGVEQCDDGNASNTDACLDTCMDASCGDGYIQAGVEQCDDQNQSNTDACLNTCQNATCGDGYVRPGVEMCDDGNQVNTDACLATCVMATCGDGFVQTGVEQCDDGNMVDNDACPNSCLLPACGDGITQPSEDCDDGNMTNTDSCLNTCDAATCGDGYVWTGVEACDDGNMIDNDGCRNNCSLPGCGDGIVQAPEQCDDGNSSNTDACLSTCLNASCGDGHVRAGVEACDDGNSSNFDACVNTCEPAACGDGYVYMGVEPCDDGNASNSDECVEGCLLAACGDGYVQTGVEACDDGNSVDDDGCSNTCQGGACGDGVQQPGEACDDGNASNTDGCLNDCKLPSCGDGNVYVGVEECDDGNGVAGDGCAPDCTDENGGQGGEGGAGGGGASGPTGPTGSGGGDGSAGEEGGCGCRVAGEGGGANGAWLALAGAVVVALRRRQRRRLAA